MASKRASSASQSIRIEPQTVQTKRRVIGARVRPVCSSCGRMMRANKSTPRATYYYCQAGCPGSVKAPRPEPPAAC